MEALTFLGLSTVKMCNWGYIEGNFLHCLGQSVWLYLHLAGRRVKSTFLALGIGVRVHRHCWGVIAFRILRDLACVQILCRLYK